MHNNRWHRATAHLQFIIIIIINWNWFVTKFTSGGPYEKHVVATWNLGNHLNIRF
jgi:hypothetical protein